MAAAGSSKTKHLGVGGGGDMTLVTVQGSEVLGSGLKPFFRASDLQTFEPRTICGANYDRHYGRQPRTGSTHS